ncbi:hypothetical protein Misp01_42580 [Microtetraspora sp. NBRC 13810]|nr:hypothetical protein Misp01_42580 [Microtetraspora sp. NBRC 13810]
MADSAGKAIGSYAAGHVKLHFTLGGEKAERLVPLRTRRGGQFERTAEHCSGARERDGRLTG